MICGKKPCLFIPLLFIYSFIFRNILDKLYPLFFTNLKDGIPSVRQGASGALANVVKAYGMCYYFFNVY